MGIGGCWVGWRALGPCVERRDRESSFRKLPFAALLIKVLIGGSCRLVQVPMRNWPTSGADIQRRLDFRSLMLLWWLIVFPMGSSSTAIHGPEWILTRIGPEIKMTKHR